MRLQFMGTYCFLLAYVYDSKECCDNGQPGPRLRVMFTRTSRVYLFGRRKYSRQTSFNLIHIHFITQKAKFAIQANTNYSDLFVVCSLFGAPYKNFGYKIVYQTMCCGCDGLSLILISPARVNNWFLDSF